LLENNSLIVSDKETTPLRYYLDPIDVAYRIFAKIPWNALSSGWGASLLRERKGVFYELSSFFFLTGRMRKFNMQSIPA
jgi:hypothetical protein